MDEKPKPAEPVSDLPPGPRRGDDCLPGCPVCGGRLVEIRAKLQCARCRTIYETCCEGGRG